MAIQHLSADEFSEILKTYLTPSGSIKTPERLFGRTKQIVQIQRALSSEGRQVLIHGDRGVGKTSLALTAAYLVNASSSIPIYTVCGGTDTFETLIASIGRRALNPEDHVETHGSAGGKSAGILGINFGLQHKQKPKKQIAAPTTINDALEIVRYIDKISDGTRVVVVDEMERISSRSEREKFAEFIKNLPEISDKVKFVFCGIGSTIEELLGAHPSAGRILENIELPKLHHSDLWSIIDGVAKKLKLSIESEMLVRIGQLSDGFPHYVHLVGETLFWSVFDDEEILKEVKARHFRAGIRGGLERAEGTLRQQYNAATMKTKHTQDYEEALWALADTSSTRRQLSEVYDWSYKRITRKRLRGMLTKEQLNQRLLALRKDSHGSVLVGHGSGWYSFRENILRGYVRLKAENEGVELGKDVR
jgi:Cdc6-like AAA superfamily ATPase